MLPPSTPDWVCTRKRCKFFRGNILPSIWIRESRELCCRKSIHWSCTFAATVAKKQVSLVQTITRSVAAFYSLCFSQHTGRQVGPGRRLALPFERSDGALSPWNMVLCSSEDVRCF